MKIKDTGTVVHARSELKERPYLKGKPWVKKLSVFQKIYGI